MTENEFRSEFHTYLDQQYDKLNENKKHVLDIFKVFHDICERNNLKYFVGFGSLLGLIRDGGFIPWDSDFDVCIPIDIAEKVIEVLERELPRSYFFESNFTNNAYPYYQIRIGKDGYNLEKTHLDIFYAFGVELDPNKLKKIQDSYVELFNKRIIKLSYLTELKSMKKRSKVQNVKMAFYYIKTMFCSVNSLNKKFDKITKQIKYESCSCFSVFGHVKNVYMKSDIEPMKLVTINEITAYIPNNEIAVLNNSYKNYKEYLPIHIRFEEYYSWVKSFQELDFSADYRK